MFFVVGLGNPGRRYSRTRHNLGFEVVDLLAEKLRLTLEGGKGEYLIARGMADDTPIGLVKPLTYMNESGLAVSDIVERYELPLENVLVICDDFQLPLGQLRIRLQGSDGGHNGLSSIIYHLQSDQFPRLRCGIGSTTMPLVKEQLPDFVLSEFSETERPVARAMVERAADAALFVVTRSAAAAMNEYNKRLTQQDDTLPQ